MYSRTWYETFLHRIPSERTEPELAFLMRQLPLDGFPAVLDVCCGAGRHAAPLAEAGYRVTGVDIDQDVLDSARRVSPDNPRYLRADMRALPLSDGDVFDAAMIMWQSWGYFSTVENDGVLRGLATKLRPGGRLVLDVYHRHFFERHAGVRQREEAGVRVVERKTMDGSRLTVELAYDGVPTDRFEWELLSPRQLDTRAADLGFRTILTCAGFDEGVEPRGDQPRFQAVFERVERA